MIEWVLTRIADILLASLLMALMLWFLLTQPLFSFGKGQVPNLALDRNTLETQLREVMALTEGQTDDVSRFAVTAEYLRKRFAETGSFEELDRGEGLKIFRVRLGKPNPRRFFIGMHYVVTDNPILEVAETTISLFELTRLFALVKEGGTQLDLVIFLHRKDLLSQGLADASVFHVEQIMQKSSDKDSGLLFAPGLRVPDAVYTSDQWKYYSLLLPSAGSELSFFGRLKDFGRLRRLKTDLQRVGLSPVNSINIPASFPGMHDSPMKYYWDQDFPMILVRPNILVNDRDFYGHINFISSMFGLLNQKL